MHICRRTGLGVGLALALAGCGGSGGGGDGADSGTTGVVSAGTIDAFGSIVVNGRRYEIDDAEIEQDGRRLDVDDLELGMRVVVLDDDDDDDAERVQLDEAVRGLVDAVDVAGGQLTVMGQTVITSAATRFDDPLTGLGDLQPGDEVEVMGLRNADDHIEAVYLERRNGGVPPYTVTGRIGDLDEGALRFTIGGLTVDYQNARIDDDVELADGHVVEVKDADRTYAAGSGLLVATKIDDADAVGEAGPGRWIEIERIVTAVNGDGTFVAGGDITVDPSGAVFRRGTAADIAVGVFLEIEGVIGEGGVLLAREITFEDREVDIEGPVDAVDTGAGTVTVLGIEVRVDGKTEFDDFGGLGDLSPGDFVEIEGRVAAGGVVAREIEREDDEDSIELKGPVSEFDAGAGTLVILGRTLVTDSATEFDELSRSDFFARLVAGASIVEAEWEAGGFTGVASTPVDELELERDDERRGGDDDDDDDGDEDDDGSQGDDDVDDDDADDD